MTNKEVELRALCKKWLGKAFSTGVNQDPHSADNSEFYLPMIEFTWSKEMAEEITRSDDALMRDAVKQLRLCRAMADAMGAVQQRWYALSVEPVIADLLNHIEGR